jgi:hypothetical protein
MEKTTRTVISKSSKRKMSTPTKQKANDFTEQVVYRTKMNNGKTHSITKHERRQKV